MAPHGKTKKLTRGKEWMKLELNEIISFGKLLIFDPNYTWLVAMLLLIAEVAVNIFVINTVKCEYFLGPFFAFLGPPRPCLLGRRGGLDRHIYVLKIN